MTAGRVVALDCDPAEPDPEADLDPSLLIVMGGDWGRSVLASSTSSSTTALRCSSCRRRRMLMFQLRFRPSPVAPAPVPLVALVPVFCAARLSAIEPNDGGGGPPPLEERARHAAIILRTLDTGESAGLMPEAEREDTDVGAPGGAGGDANTGFAGSVASVEPEDVECSPSALPYGDGLESFRARLGGALYWTGPRSSGAGGGRALRTCQLARGASRIDGTLSGGSTLPPRPRVLGVALGVRVCAPKATPGEVAPAARDDAEDTTPVDGTDPSAVFQLRPLVLLTTLFEPDWVGRLGVVELATPLSNIFMRFETLALLGVLVGEERFGAGASSAAPARFVGVVRLVCGDDWLSVCEENLVGDLLGTGGASGEVEYGGGAALLGPGEVCADRAVWKLPATLERESGEPKPPSPPFGGTVKTGELALGAAAMLLLGEGGNGSSFA